MLAIQIFLWIFMIGSFSMMMDTKTTKANHYLFSWFVSLLLLIATVVFL